MVALGELNFLGHNILNSQGMLPNSNITWSLANAPLNHHPTGLPTASRPPNSDHSGNLRWECRVNRKLIFWKINWNRKILTSSRYRISIFYPIWTLSGRNNSYTITGNTLDVTGNTGYLFICLHNISLFYFYFCKWSIFCVQHFQDLKATA